MDFVSESRKELNRRIAESAEAPVRVEPIGPRFHQVKKGDTLFSVARKYKTSPLTIARANNFTSGRQKLRTGSRLNLHEKSGPVVLAHVEDQKVTFRMASPKVKIGKGPLVYKVTRGDNLKELAKLFGLRVREIKTANKMKRNTITVGQKIVLPDTKRGIYEA